MSSKERIYKGNEISISFDLKRCIHSEECVKGLPSVFDPNKRPWINPDEDSASAIEEVVSRCPTGALKFRYPDESITEAVPDENVVQICKDGPLYLRGRIEIEFADGRVLKENRVALCRCGKSANKPFCDNAHSGGNFRDKGMVPEGGQESKAKDSSSLEIRLAPNGPLLGKGPMRVRSSDLSSESCVAKAAFCRCGKSSNKPFCDGAHARFSFEAE